MSETTHRQNGHKAVLFYCDANVPRKFCTADKSWSSLDTEFPSKSSNPDDSITIDPSFNSISPCDV